MRWRTCLLVVLPVFLQIGCGNHLYKQWDQRLTQMTEDCWRGQFYTVDDVSFILGSRPVNCEPVDPPTRFFVGIYFDPQLGEDGEPRITSIIPDSPASAGGFRVGDRILRVGSQAVESVRESLAAWHSQARIDTSIRIVTDRATLDVIPSAGDYQQCYWDIKAGRVATSGAYASWNQYGGSGASRSAAYNRFYKATCRFVNGSLFAFRSNWQM